MPPARAVITLTRYSEPTALVCETLDSVRALAGEGLSVHVCDQRDDPGLAGEVARRSTAGLPMRCETIPARSLSFARNHALAAAEAPVVLYLDPDALVEPDWALRLLAAFEEQPEAVLVGARILPLWRAAPPRLARARFVRDQYSLIDLGDARRAYHRVVGAAFGVHAARLRALLGAAARFDEALGRREGRLLSGEESDLCARALAAGGQVLYEGRAVAHHQIMPERASTGWILRRFYYSGLARAMVGGTPSPSSAPEGWERLALAAVAGPYALGYLAGRWARWRTARDGADGARSRRGSGLAPMGADRGREARENRPDEEPGRDP